MNRRCVVSIWLLCLALLLTSSARATAQAQVSPAKYIRENYTKQEQLIPMRDGVRLFTAIYMPKDTSKKYPMLIMRTPYSVSPYGADKYRDALAPSHDFEREGYIFVLQDVRGRFMSEGQFENMRPHIDDKKSKNDID